MGKSIDFAGFSEISLPITNSPVSVLLIYLIRRPRFRQTGKSALLKRRPAIIPQPSDSGVDNAQPTSPMKALALLSTLQSADIVLPTTDGREIRLRRITEPTTEQKSLLHRLGINLPERLKSSLKCSADSAIA